MREYDLMALTSSAIRVVLCPTWVSNMVKLKRASSQPKASPRLAAGISLITFFKPIQIQTRAHKCRSKFPGVRNLMAREPCAEGFRAVAAFEMVQNRRFGQPLKSFLGNRQHVLPMFVLQLLSKFA